MNDKLNKDNVTTHLGIDKKPNYEINMNEGRFDTVYKNELIGKLTPFIWAIIGIMVFASLLFQDNLFMEISFASKILLVGLVCTEIGRAHV